MHYGLTGEQPGKADATMTKWTLNGCGDVETLEGFFDSLDAARLAWTLAGLPRERGSSVWATEHSVSDWTTVRTVTLSP
jgi:hypothetical protein